MKKILAGALLVLMVIILFGALSCGQGVPQTDYDNIKSQLDQAESQLKDLQNKPPVTVTVTAPAGTQTTDVNQAIADLKKQIDAYASQIQALGTQKQAAEASLADLTTKYNQLQKQYQALTAPPPPFTEEDVEQALFGLINQDRIANNVTALQFGKNLYLITKQHGQYMYDNSRFEPSSWPFYQEIFWGAGYSSAEGMAKGALLVWKNFQYHYEHGELSKAFTYGAVGAYKAGEVFYITFMAANVP